MESRRMVRLAGPAFMAVVFLTGIILAAAAPAPLSAQQWPVLKQGMWEFTRTMQEPGGGAPRTITSKRCLDPSADMQRQNATMVKAGCTISAPARSGNTYTFTSSCNMRGMASKMKSTIVVESDSAYTLSVEGTTGGEPVREVMKARRIGDCSR